MLKGDNEIPSENQMDSFASSSCTGTFNVVNIPLSNVVLCKPGVVNVVCISSSVIITGGINEIGYCVAVYSVHGLVNFVQNPVEQQRITISSLCQSTIPMSVTEPSFNTPILTCIWPSGSLSNHQLSYTLDRTVFELLFGSEASLFDLCVVLIGTCEGHVYFFPLASDMTSQDVLTPKDKLKQSSLLQNMAERKTRSFTLAPSLLYCLEQPVSAISLARIPFIEVKDKKAHAENAKVTCGNCVLFVGKRNKLVVSYQNRSSRSNRNAVFAECQIPGPVWSSTVEETSNVFMHSTGQEIFISKLEIQCTELSSQATPEQVVITTIHCIKLPFACVMVNVTPATLEQCKDNLIVLTLKGKLQKLDISNIHDSSSRFLLMKISPTTAGNKIKCLLSEIERISKKLSQLNLSIKAEDTILKDLNIVTSLICRIMDKHTQKMYGMPKKGSDCVIDILCSVIPTVREAGNVTSPLVNLQCKVVNQWTATFGKGWSLLVQVNLTEQGTVNPTGCQKTTSKAVPLNMFASGQHVVLEFPLHSVVLFNSVKVLFFLHFDLNAVLSNLDGNTCISAESVVIPLDVKMLDVIDFLRPVTRNKSCFETPEHLMVDRRAISLQQKISTALKSVNSRLTSRADGLESATNNTNKQITCAQTSYQSILFLSQSCIHYISQQVQTNKHLCGTKEPITLEESVLIFLTNGNKAFMLADCQQGFVKTETPTGKQIELRVQPRSKSTSDVPQIEMGEKRCKFELVLQAPTVQLICSLHEAVLTRLKVRYENKTR